MAQTSYAEMAVAFAGMKATAHDDDVDTYVQGEASAEIPFGVMVCQGTGSNATGTPDKAILPVDANSIPVGVVIHSHDYAIDTDLGTTGLKPKTLMNVMRRGRCWVEVEGAVAINGIAYFRHTANGGNTQKGKFRADADTANATKMRGVRFVTATSGAGLAMIEVNMPSEMMRGVTGY